MAPFLRFFWGSEARSKRGADMGEEGQGPILQPRSPRRPGDARPRSPVAVPAPQTYPAHRPRMGCGGRCAGDQCVTTARSHACATASPRSRCRCRNGLPRRPAPRRGHPRRDPPQVPPHPRPARRRHAPAQTARHP